jgi:hypothetical protein
MGHQERVDLESWDEGEERKERHYRRLPHSGLGIASLAIAVATGLALLVLITIAAVLEGRPGGMPEDSPTTIIIGALAIGCLLVCLLGLALGIAGLVQQGRDKVLAVLGVVFNGGLIVGVIALAIIGTVMG